MADPQPYKLAHGRIQRNRTGKGSPYRGRLRITPDQIQRLQQWSDRNDGFIDDQGRYYELDIAAWIQPDRHGGHYIAFRVLQPLRSSRVPNSAAPVAPPPPPAEAPSRQPKIHILTDL